jgi:hypothetical protein
MVSRPWNLDIRQPETRPWYGQMSRPSRCSLHQEEFTFGEHSSKPTIRKALIQQWNTGEVVWWFGQQYHGSASAGPIIIFHGRITARRYVDRLDNQVHPMIRPLFPNNDAVCQDDNVPFTQLELFSHGLNSMKVNIIFPGQQNHHIRTSLNHCGQLWRLEWGTDSHFQLL